MVSYHPDPPQLLRARLQLALHSRGGQELNQLIHHERGRYSRMAMDDLDAVRAALGYRQLDVIGGSYGATAHSST